MKIPPELRKPEEYFKPLTTDFINWWNQEDLVSESKGAIFETMVDDYIKAKNEEILK